MAYVVEQVFPADDPRGKLTMGPSGTARSYRLVFELAVPGRDVVQRDFDFKAPETGGDSLLVAPAGAVELGLDVGNAPGESRHMTIHLNGEKRLRSISLELEAADFRDAAKQGHDLVMPAISRW